MLPWHIVQSKIAASSNPVHILLCDKMFAFTCLLPEGFFTSTEFPDIKYETRFVHANIKQLFLFNIPKNPTTDINAAKNTGWIGIRTVGFLYVYYIIGLVIFVREMVR